MCRLFGGSPEPPGRGPGVGNPRFHRVASVILLLSRFLVVGNEKRGGGHLGKYLYPREICSSPPLTSEGEARRGRESANDNDRFPPPLFLRGGEKGNLRAWTEVRRLTRYNITIILRNKAWPCDRDWHLAKPASSFFLQIQRKKSLLNILIPKGKKKKRSMRLAGERSGGDVRGGGGVPCGEMLLK